MSRNGTLLLLTTLWMGTAWGQTVVPTVQEALALARRNNPELINARQNRLVQEQQRVASRAALRPQARLYSNLDYNYALPVQLIPLSLFGGGSDEYRSVRFGLPFVLLATGEITAPLVNRAARADLALAEQNLRIIDDQTLVLQDEISTQTARVYHAALLTRAAIALTRRNLLAADTLVQIARARLDKGQIEPLEYNRIRQVQLTTADVLSQNQLSYGRNLAQLKLLLGLAPTDSLLLTDDLLKASQAPGPLPDATSLDRPQLSMRRAQLDLARRQIGREQLAFWPTLAAYGRYSQQAQRDQFNFLNVSQRWFEIGVVGVQFNLPLYTGGLRQGNLARARLLVQLAESQLAYEQHRQQTDTDDIRQAYDQALRSLELNRQNDELSRQNVQIALVKYRSGLFAYDQYLNVFNETLTAQNRYLNALSTLFINQTLWQIRFGQ
ncbi:Outer membrane protein-like protein [Fibrella aestuarina BUZ 2]|uniref:Outer membrane protein-like protein n=1 Tax=Fibrella aestuarina BUZ 2 TaxID=1166018 RepID=I0K7W1_9BACT|nr:TolC family protein [Fibrella aestuarina]CCH00214.1 Outer membrane protein-like protein [Fibrella aestuarina BUZ 2]